MKKKSQVKFKPFTVTGKGDSLWCKKEVTKGVKFKVSHYQLNDFLDTGEPYELQLFGPTTEWVHYTDSGIRKGVNDALLPFLRATYPDYKIDHISWSEQGMQPENGWSFDIITKN